MPTKRRRLSDLYVIGAPASFNDGAVNPDTGKPYPPIDVWVQKLNTPENDEALRQASAARARHLSYVRDEESPEWQQAYTDTVDFANRDTLISLAIADELRLRSLKIEAELAAEEEWSKDDYLQGLVDAWEGRAGHPDVQGRIGLKERYAEDPHDPEAARVKEELDRFNQTANEMVEREREALRTDWENVDEDVLRRQSVKRVLEQRATAAFIQEHEYWLLYFAVREAENHAQRYFVNRDEVAATDERIRNILLEKYQEIAVEPVEGKDLPGTPGSSPSSEPSEPEATSEPSGLEDAPT